MTFLEIDIFNGAVPLLVVYLGFSIIYFLNMIGGIIINCQIEKIEEFKLERILISLEKILFCAIVSLALVVSTNLVSQGLFKIEEELSNVVTSVISIGVFALVFAKGFLQKTSNLVDKVKYMLEINSSNDIDDKKIEDISRQSIKDLIYNPELEPDAEDEVG